MFLRLNKDDLSDFCQFMFYIAEQIFLSPSVSIRNYIANIKIGDLSAFDMRLRHVFLGTIFIKNFSIWMMDLMIIMMTMWRAFWQILLQAPQGSCLVAADLVHPIKSAFLLTSCKDGWFLIWMDLSILSYAGIGGHQGGLKWGGGGRGKKREGGQNPPKW